MTTIQLPSNGKDFLPIGPVRAHVENLRAHGGKVAQIARISGVNSATLHDLLATGPTKRFPRGRTRVLKTTAIAVLAVTPEVLRGDVAPVSLERVTDAVWVPVETVRAHIRLLQASGMTLRLIGEQAGFDRRRLSSYLSTAPTVANPTPVERVPRSASRRILAIKPFESQSPNKAVDSAPAIRRLQAMVVVGYSYGMIGKLLGCSAQNVLIKLTSPTMQVVHADAIREMYSRYAFIKPKYANGQSAVHGRRNIARAREQGWLGPMEWDDIEAGIVADASEDEAPVDEFSVDEVILEGILLGEHSKTLTRAEQWEAIRRLRDAGVGINETARRIGMSDRQVLRRVNELKAEEAAAAAGADIDEIAA